MHDLKVLKTQSMQSNSFLSFKLYMRINLQNQMQNMHRQIFPLSILDTLFLLGQQVLKILKSLLDVTPTTILFTDCIVATFVVEAIKLRLKLFLFTASKTQRLKGQEKLNSLLASTLYAKKTQFKVI